MDQLAAFVTADWLVEHRDEVTVVDCRWSLDGSEGRSSYLGGHIPGAVFADLDQDLAAPPSRAQGRHPLPSPEDFAATRTRLGLGDGAAVVAYDTAGGAIAARLVWMLRAVGEQAAVLDGGLAAWDGPLEQGPVRPKPEQATARPWPQQRIADDELVARAAGGRQALVVDARSPERYRGDHEPVDPRAGHIPGAVNLPFADNLGPDGRLRDSAALSQRFAAAASADDVIVYCGSGVTACHDLLAMEHVGIEARLFPGSWSRWSADPERPVATGERP